MTDQNSTRFSPPPGGDENRGWQFLVVTWSFFCISFVLLVLRLYTRSRIVKNLGSDDYWIVSGVVSAVASEICSFRE